MTQDTKSFKLVPTLDLVGADIDKNPGVMIAAMNHEPVDEGMQRMEGFERSDGQPYASETHYYVLNFDAGTATIASGATVTGATSGATGKTLVAMVVSSGSFGASDAAGYLVLELVTGTFQDNENLQVAAVTKCVANDVAAIDGAIDDDNDDTWAALAQENARARILAIPGEGNVLGSISVGGTVYGFRNAVGSASAAMWKQTTTGWTAVALGRRVAFTSGGVYEILEGNTITGATSGATAVITRVMMTAATDWTTGTAEGWLIFASQTGVFQAENLNVGANLNVATIAVNSSAITLPANGRYEYVLHNFSGGAATRRAYGVNGVGPAFEFDGTVFAPIQGPKTPDTPKHVSVHREHLLLAYPGGIIVNAGPLEPFNFTAAFGAGEYGLGADCTGFIGPYANNMIVMARQKTAVLYGNDVNDFQLLDNSSFAGAIEWTGALLGEPIYFDDAGLRSAKSGANYGDFNIKTITSRVKPLLDGLVEQGVLPVGSVVAKKKGQYRVFFDDNSGLFIWFGGKFPMILPFDLGKLVTHVCAHEDSDGIERMFFGSSDGFLYRLDSGNNLDGTEIEAYFRPAFNSCGSPNYEKRFHGATIEGRFRDTATLAYAAEYSYGDANSPPAQERNAEIAGNGGIWSENYLWNEFLWSSAIVGKQFIKLYGKGENISVAFTSTMTYERPYVLKAMSLNFTPRKLTRGK